MGSQARGDYDFRIGHSVRTGGEKRRFWWC